MNTGPINVSWELNTSWTTLLYKIIIVAKLKEVETAPNRAEFCKEAYGSTRAAVTADADETDLVVSSGEGERQ
jgi:hypothetical protein